MIGAAVGSEVHAVRDGTVYFTGNDSCCYGNFIIIAHDEGWSSVYGHLSEFRVKVGDQVKQGDVIGLSGDTGHVTGPHLHFELRLNGVPVDPLDHFWPSRYVMADDPSTPAPEQAIAPPPTLQSPDAPTADPSVAQASDHLGSQEAVVLAIDWLVTCKGTAQGCVDASCDRYLSACVLDQPRLIAQFCQ